MSDNDRGFALGPDPLPTQHYIDMRDAIIAGLKQDIATLQSQLQSVAAERDAARAWAAAWKRAALGWRARFLIESLDYTHMDRKNLLIDIVNRVTRRARRAAEAMEQR